ncbi:MAG: hypothetical protein GX573_03895 [Chloroflexi bacterium]|nr:hypothetical protein [Chloroflexota bacterium]
MDTLFRIHSDLRWLLVAVAVLAVIRLVIGWLRRESPYDPISRSLMLLFSIGLDIQVLVGLIYFIWNGIDADYWPRQRFEHLVVMLIAAGVAHLPRRWRSAPAPVRYRNDALTVLAVLVIVFVGVILLPGGTNRW